MILSIFSFSFSFLLSLSLSLFSSLHGWTFSLSLPLIQWPIWFTMWHVVNTWILECLFHVNDIDHDDDDDDDGNWYHNIIFIFFLIPLVTTIIIIVFHFIWNSLLFGTTQLFVFKHPEQEQKSLNTFSEVTFELAQEEIAAKAGYSIDHQDQTMEVAILNKDLVCDVKLILNFTKKKKEKEKEKEKMKTKSSSCNCFFSM